MGFRFRKSFKLAPGVKLNIGKKSMGISVGGKYGGISHNTETGTRARVTAYGTGLSYSTKFGGKKKQMKKTNETTNSPQTSNGSCLITCLKGCLLIILSPLYWIYGVIWFIFLRKKLNNDPKAKKKATTKCAIFTALSLLIFGIARSNNSATPPTEPAAIVAESETLTEQEISEKTTPQDNFKDIPNKQLPVEETETVVEEIVSGETAVEETISEETTVVETIPEETAVEETISEETTVVETIPEETTVVETIPEETTVVETIPEETTSESVSPNSEQENELYTQLTEAETTPVISNETTSVETPVVEQSSENSNDSVTTDDVTQTTPEPTTPPVVPTTSQSDTTMVWIDDTAKRYHKKNGCGMNNAYQVTLEEAVAKGKTPCGRCYK